MKLRKVLADLARAISDAAERNPDFQRRMAAALGIGDEPARREPRALGEGGGDGRPKNRRPPAAVDPVELVRSGEQALRSRLGGLSVEQLKDIVADHGMDPGKLITKWKTADRIVERIVEISLARSQKGDAFRSE